MAQARTLAKRRLTWQFSMSSIVLSGSNNGDPGHELVPVARRQVKNTDASSHAATEGGERKKNGVLAGQEKKPKLRTTESYKPAASKSRFLRSKSNGVDYRRSATLSKAMQRIPSGSGARQRSYTGYVYVPRSFNPRSMRDCDSDEEDSAPLDLDFDERLVRPRVSSIVCLKLDEIERGVLELDPFENTDLKKDLKRIKQQCELALDTHDQALRRSRRLDKMLLDSFHDKIDEIGEDLILRHNACMQSFQRLKANSRAALDLPTASHAGRHSSASEGTPEPVFFEAQRAKHGNRPNLADFRNALNQQFR